MEQRPASDSLPKHVQAARRARRTDQMRGYRAKKALLNPPKPKHIVPPKKKVRNDQRKVLRANDPLQKKKVKLQMRISRARKEYQKRTTEVEQATAEKNEAQHSDHSDAEARLEHAKARLAAAELRFAVAQVRRFTFNQKHGIVIKDIPSARFFELAQTVEDSTDDDHTDAEATPGTDVDTDSGELELDKHVSVKNEPESHDDVSYQSEHLSDDDSSDAESTPDTDIETNIGELDLEEHAKVKNNPPKPQSPPRQFPIFKRQSQPTPLPKPKRARKQSKKQSKIQKKQPMSVNPWTIAKRA